MQGRPGARSMAAALRLGGHFVRGRPHGTAAVAGWHRRLNKIFTQQPHGGGPPPNSPTEKPPSESGRVFPEIPSGPLSEKFLETFTHVKGRL